MKELNFDQMQSLQGGWTEYCNNLYTILTHNCLTGSTREAAYFGYINNFCNQYFDFNTAWYQGCFSQ